MPQSQAEAISSLLDRFCNFQWNGKGHNLSVWMVPDGAKLTHVMWKVDPHAELPNRRPKKDDLAVIETVPAPLYYRLYRLLKTLERAGLMELSKGVSTHQEGEHKGIFAAPTTKLIYLIDRMQNSTRFAGKGNVTPGWEEIVDRIQHVTRDQENPDRLPDLLPASWNSWVDGRDPITCRSCIFRRDCKRKPENKGDLNLAAFAYTSRCPYKCTERSRRERKSAAFKLKSISGRVDADHWLFVRKGRTKESPGEIQPALRRRLDEVQKNFDLYLQETLDRKILLKKRGTKGKKGIGELILDYKTRFSDEGRRKGAVKQFHEIWREAAKFYDAAVVLCLTSNPAGNNDLWDVDRHFPVAWNAYLSTLTKRFRARKRDQLIDGLLSVMKSTDPERWARVDRRRLLHFNEVRLHNATKGWRTKWYPYMGLTREERGEIVSQLDEMNFRPRYLLVNEFQENGLLHAHIAIFGTDWIDKIEQIQEDWDRLGQGKIAHAYAILYNPGQKKWEWMKAQPSDSRNRDPVDYLIKYLNKGMFTLENFGMYWTINKRFFTNTQALNGDFEPVRHYGSGEWEFIGSFQGDDIPARLLMENRGAPLLHAWDGWSVIKPQRMAREAFV